MTHITEADIDSVLENIRRDFYLRRQEERRLQRVIKLHVLFRSLRSIIRRTTVRRTVWQSLKEHHIQIRSLRIPLQIYACDCTRFKPLFLMQRCNRRLKADLQYLRRRGLFKASGELSYQGRKCARCGAPFGRFYNTGASCTRCRHRVCRQCRIEVRGPTDNKDVEWICNVCYKIAELHVVTGKWMYENSAESVKSPESPVDIIKHNIRRAWTINGPPTRWSAARKSPELRIYRSLPSRHQQEYREPTEAPKILEKEIFKCNERRTAAINSDKLNEYDSGDSKDSTKDCWKDEPRRESNLPCHEKNERTNSKRAERAINFSSKQEDEVPSADVSKLKRIERFSAAASAKTRTESQEEANNIGQEQTTPRVSLIKPPRILSKLISLDIKGTSPKHGERKSNIPIFKRSSKEFEDIRSPQESPKRSLIPQRYRGSTDDLRRSREDISVPSLIPKLLSPRNKEDRLKRQDSKDDIRSASKLSRRDSRDEARSPFQSSGGKEDSAGNKIGTRLFRRDFAKEDVGRECANSSAGICVAAKGKQQQQQQASGKEERQERTEERVGDTPTTSKSKPLEVGRTKLFGSRDCRENLDSGSVRGEQENLLAQPRLLEDQIAWDADRNEEGSMLSKSGQSKETIDEEKKQCRIEREGEDSIEETRDSENVMVEDRVESSVEKNEDSMKDAAEILADGNDVDVTANGINDRRGVVDACHAKKQDEFQVVRRKFSKEEFSNPDDTDDTPNKRCSSHLSPEASPLSTRSSRYSPRESESEPTPALPRKTGGDSSSASQRIRDAITRTRRESNSSTRYESSGSESVRLSETGLHGYVELARKVKFFGGTGSGTVPSIVGSDEVVQRDSATSAGEDEPHDDSHGRTGPVSSQGRTMLRRRRQFDAQGSRRRGRSHARTCCGEELQSLQALHVIGRDGRQQSPTGNQGQDQPIVDYRRLVFISSDSSSGREEDDADSSCSSSSYLNGLQRGAGHHRAQSLEDCDWDYFESGSLPLPSGVPVVIGTSNVGTDPAGNQDWSCCPGRGSACQACGGSRGTNVLPVPVPIPVPVPYPVPVPAALWTGDFAAAASSMISREAHTEQNTLRLRGDPAAPWFAWHPRFNQPLHGTRLDPRLTGVFDPATCTFRPDQVLAPRLYGSAVEPDPIPTDLQLKDTQGQDEKDEASVPITTPKPEEASQGEVPVLKNAEAEAKCKESSSSSSAAKLSRAKTEDVKANGRGQKNMEQEELSDKRGEEDKEEVEDSLSGSFESNRGEEKMYQHLREDCRSSSGRSSADSSDLEDDSSSHRFSRVFVVNDDSLTSDNDIEDNEEEDDDSDSAAEGGVTLKRVTALPEEEPVILQHVRFLNEDGGFERTDAEKSETKNGPVEVGQKVRSRTSGDENHCNDTGKSGVGRSNHVDRRRGRKKNYLDTEDEEGQIPVLLEHRLIPEEVYLANDNDGSDNLIELKSVKTLDPDSMELPPIVHKAGVVKVKEIQIDKGDLDRSNNDRSGTDSSRLENTDLSAEPKSPLSTDVWESTIIPDSLEISSELSNGGVSFEDFGSSAGKIGISPPGSVRDDEENAANTSIIGNNCESPSDKLMSVSATAADESFDRFSDNSLSVIANSSVSSTTDSSNNETNTTGSEVSSDELHEYEVTPLTDKSYSESEPPMSAINDELLYRMIRRNENGKLTSIYMNRHDDIMETSNEEDYTDDSKTSSDSKSFDSKNLGASIASNSQHDSLPNSYECSSFDLSTSGRSKFAEVSDASQERQDTRCADSASGTESAHDSVPVRSESPGQVVGVGDSGGDCAGSGGVGVGGGGSDGANGEEEGSTRFRSVERRPSTRKENGFPSASAKNSVRDAQPQQQQQPQPTSASNSANSSGNNRYRSFVMITQEASYQPVSVITSDTTTLLQPDEVHATGQGLAGYFQLALEAVAEQPHRKSGQGPRRPLMVKRLSAPTSNQSEPEVDSGLSVGSASESDDVSVKNASKIRHQDVIRETGAEESVRERQQQQQQDNQGRTRVSSQSSDDNSASGGVVILEEGLADDDSWVEEVSHDEDEQATTATEESSEDEANNLGDREEELRGYHRQAIDFTLHTIVEESCEESEAEPSLATGSPSKKPRPPSASELEKYFFFGLGGDGNSSSIGSREVDSLSETSSIYSEGLESLGQDEVNGTSQGQERTNSGEGFLNSSRLEKYFLSEFLGFDQDRRDSDGSVGSDSEGRPSPEAQRRKRLVRARGTGRSHSSSLDNLLALTQSSQNLSSQNSLQDLSLNQDGQDSQSEGSSTETDGADDGQAPAFGTDGQFDTVKRKKKKPRNLGTQSPRVPDDRNKTPEPAREMVLVGEVVVEGDADVNSEDSDRAKTPQPEAVLSSSSSPCTSTSTSTMSSSQIDSSRSVQLSAGDSSYNQRAKQQSRDSGFVGSCDDLLQHQKLPDEAQTNPESNQDSGKDHRNESKEIPQTTKQGSSNETIELGKHSSVKMDHPLGHATIPHLPNASLSRKDSFNNWSSDEETNLMMSKMRQFFKTMVATSNGQGQNIASTNSTGVSPAPSPRLPGYSSKARLCAQNRTKPPQLVYFENELTRLMKTVPGIRDEQVREIVEYLSSEDTWSDSYDSSDYTSSDLEGAAGGRRSALQEQISQSCQQIISKFDTTSGDNLLADKDREDKTVPTMQPPCLGRDTAFVYQKLVQSFTKMAGDGVSSDANSTPHSSPPLIAKVMHHIGSRLVALMHEVSEGGSAVQHHSSAWRRYSQHHRTPSSASTTEDDDSTSDSTNAPSSAHLQLPRSKSHDPLLLINSHPAASAGQEGEEREASDYERFSWRGSFESALMAADSRTRLSLLACSGDVSVGASASASALAMAAKRRSAGDLLFNPKSFSREQLDRVRSCGSIGGGSGGGASGGCGGSIEDRIWSNRRRSSVPDANTRGESGASAGDEDTEDELEYGGESRATTLPRGMQSALSAATNSLPRLPASTAPTGLTTTPSTPSSTMHKAHSVYHFLPQHSGVKSARYRPPGFARNSNVPGSIGGPKRAVSAPGLQVSGSQAAAGKRDNSRSRRQQAMSLTPDDGSSLSEACSTPIIGAGSRASSSHTVMDMDDMESSLHAGHLATRASLSSLGARSDSMASVYSGAGEGRCCRSVVVTGEVEFALQYDYKHLTFEVHVTKCKNLAPVDVKRKRSDPYVKVYLLPDKSKSGKRKTKVKKHTLNPEFNETLKFHMSLSGLETRTLWLTVWHSDMFGRNDFLGEVRMPLENKIFDDPTPRWYPLQERTEPFDDPVAYKGEVIVGLKFVPPDPAQQQERERELGSDNRSTKVRKNWSRGALHVLVKEARNLQTRAKNSGTCDPFCKSYLLPDKGRSGKQKTGVVRRSGGSPVWGHTFIYKDVSLQELAERGLELTVWDHDRIASNEFLGGVRFNLGTGKHYGKPVDWMDATGRELSLWQSMLERPNFWVEGAVTLRPNLHNHGKTSGP